MILSSNLFFVPQNYSGVSLTFTPNESRNSTIVSGNIFRSVPGQTGKSGIAVIGMSLGGLGVIRDNMFEKMNTAIDLSSTND